MKTRTKCVSLSNIIYRATKQTADLQTTTTDSEDGWFANIFRVAFFDVLRTRIRMWWDRHRREDILLEKPVLLRHTLWGN